MVSKKGLFILVILMAQVLAPFLSPSPQARAQDGSVDASEAVIEISADYLQNSNTTGTPWGNSGLRTDNRQTMVFIDLPGKNPEDWTWSSNYINVSMYSSIIGADSVGQLALFSYEPLGVGSVLLDNTTELSFPDEPGGVGVYRYNETLQGNEWTGTSAVYVAIWTDVPGGTFFWARQLLGAKGADHRDLEEVLAYVPPDPAWTSPQPDTAWTPDATTRYNGASLNVTGSVANSTTVNDYWGSLAGDFEAVRQYGLDVTDSRLTTINARLLKPVGEYLVNLTYWDGDSWELVPGSQWDETGYNVTHSQVVLTESDIDTYGRQYQIWTKNPAVGYWFNGLYLENGTYAGGRLVTAYLQAGSESFLVDGPDQYNVFNEVPVSFSWLITGGGSRIHYPQDDNETIWILDPGALSFVYAFDIIDYTGMIGYSDSYLKAERVINGSQKQVQTMLIQSTAQDVPMTLEYGQAYTISVILPLSVQSFGFFVAQDDFNPILILRPQGFSGGVYQSQRYLLFEGIRSEDGETIQGSYNDTGQGTTTIYFEIRWLNNSALYSASANSNQTTFQYLSCDNETDYYVWMRAVTPANYFGNITYQKALPRVVVDMPFFNFTGLGELPPNSDGQTAPQGLFSMGLTLAFVGATSAWSAPVGLVVTLLVGGVMHRWGWWTLDMTLWASALCFAIVFIIVQAKRYTGGPG